jgi:hypothetical protein
VWAIAVQVNFHRPAFFGTLSLVPTPATVEEYDCSCCAARLLRPGQLFVLPR